MDINNLSQFLQGFLAEQERQKTEKKVQKAMESGQYKVTQNFDPTTGQMKIQLEQRSPLEDLIQQGQAAQAQDAIYKAGGPAPSLGMGNRGTSLTSPNSAPASMGQPTGQPTGGIPPYRPIKLDRFGRPEGFEPNPFIDKQQEDILKRQGEQQASEQISGQNLKLVAGAAQRLAQRYADSFRQGGAGNIGRSIVASAATNVGGRLGDKYSEAAAFPGQKTETIMRLMPLLTQQGDKPGSVRLVATVFDKLYKTLPDLNTSPKAARQEMEATIMNMFGFAEAIKQLGITNEQVEGLPNEQLKNIGDHIENYAKSIQLTPQEQIQQKELLSVVLAPLDQLIQERGLGAKRNAEYEKFKQLINK